MDTEKIKKAELLMKQAHGKQKDRGGHPYYLHPIRVAEGVDTEDEKIVALLHDVVEDTDTNLEDIREMFGDTIACAVAVMTHEPDMTYEEYIKNISTNAIAKNVKLADLKDNMDLTRLKKVTPKDLERNKKYRKAREYLLSH